MKLATVRAWLPGSWKVSPYHYNSGFEPFVLECTFEKLGEALAARGILAV